MSFCKSLKIFMSVLVAALLLVTMSFSTLTEEPQKEWWKEAVVVSNCPGGMDQALRKMVPDVCNWTFTPMPPYLLARGVKYAPASGTPYQGFYYEHKNSRRFNKFRGCFVKDIYGENIPWNLWGKSYFIDPHCPKWHNEVKGKIVSRIPCCDGISEDNIGVPPFQIFKGSGGFSKWSQEGFREYLLHRYSGSELKNMGITDVESFDIARYIRDQGYLDGNERALHDPIFRNFIKYQYESNLNLWEDIVVAAEEKAQSLGKTTEIHGNQYGVWRPWHSNAYSVLLSQYNEIIEIEYGDHAGQFPPKQHYSLVYKIGLASGNHEKPVWVRDGPEPFLNKNFWRLIVAEGYANGGVREIQPDLHTPTGYYTLPDETMKALINYAGWLHKYEPLFTHKSSLAKVAIVYSIPTMMWRNFPTTGHWNQDKLYRLSGFARALEEAHIPYDVIVFNHPGVGKDIQILGDLSEYDAVILPGVDCLTDEQVQALKDYASHGGGLVATGEVGIRDQDFNPRPRPPLTDVLLFGKKRAYLSGTPAREFYENVALQDESDHLNYQRLINAVTRATGGQIPVETDAPKTVSVNLYRQKDQRLLLHLLNYNYDFNHDRMEPAEDISVKVKLPERFSMDNKKVFLLSADREGRTELEYTLEDGYLNFTVPELFIHNLVVVTQAEDFAKFPRKEEAPELAKVLFDEAHGEELTVAESRAKELKPEHPEWVLLNAISSYQPDRNLETPLTFEKLENYDLLVVATPTEFFSNREIREIKRFVQNGGGLILIGNGGIDAAMNSIARPFGVEFLGNVVGSFDPLWNFASFKVSHIPQHELTERVCEVTMYWGCAIEPNEDWKVVLKTPEDTWLDQNWNRKFDQTEPKGPFGYLAVTSLSEGRIAAIADDHVFGGTSGVGGGYGRLVYNMVSWVAELTTHAER